MPLSREQVLAIAHLARLQVDETEIDGFAAELTGILAVVDQLSGVDVSGVEPLAHPTDMTQRLRADEVTEPNARDSLLAAAPQSDAGLFLVPRVIE